MKEIDLGEKINSTNITFRLCPDLWSDFNFDKFNVSTEPYNW